MSESKDEIPEVLHHYTSAEGRTGIVESKTINPSLKENNPRDARYGDGQYLSDIPPGSKTGGQLSYEFYGQPFQKARVTDYVSIKTEGLSVKKGRANVFVVLGNEPLDISERLVDEGENKK
ncbi:hypothetical protein ABVY78_004639 [Vibrio parahaemolyticus]